MRVKVTETNVYTWGELSDAAKDHAREQHSRFLWDDGVAAESMQLIFDGVMEAAGWSDLSNLTYDLYQQGGYPEWAGTLRGFEHGGLKWTVTTQNGHRYGRSVDVEPEWETDDDPDRTDAETEAALDAARDMVSALSSELFYKFRAEDEYMTADEQMAETSEANGYEYTEAGDLV